MPTRKQSPEESAELLLAFQTKLEERWLTPVAAFRAADEDGNGIVTADELAAFLGTIGLGTWMETHAADLHAVLDVSGDGQVDLNEFLRMLERASSLREQRSPVKEVSPVHVDEDSKFISLVAHNEMKSALKSFVASEKAFFSSVPLVTTGSTGKTLKKALGIPVERLVASGPLGGDQAIGGMISEGKIAAIFFFKDPLSAHAHSADIEALTRLCDVHQIPYATNRASAVGILMALKAFGIDWKVGTDEESAIEKYRKTQARVIDEVAGA
jgi:methylglyoxal synthase